MSEKDGDKDGKSSKVWWQIKLEEQEAQIIALEAANRAQEPARSLDRAASAAKALAAELEQKNHRLQEKLARVDLAAAHLIQTHEEAEAIIANFKKYADNFESRNYHQQMDSLASRMRTAAQRYRRER